MPMMTVPESILVGSFTLVVVFALLVCVYALIKLLSVIVAPVTRKSGTKPAAQAPSGPDAADGDYSAGTLRLKGVDEPTAAMLMAIVSEESGIPLSELCFKSIRLLPDEGAGDKE